MTIGRHRNLTTKKLRNINLRTENHTTGGEDKGFTNPIRMKNQQTVDFIITTN